MTRSELRQRLQNGEILDDLFTFSEGQECMIFQANVFFTSDEIIYIPDLDLNGIITDQPIKDEEEIEAIIQDCYTGNDFVDICDGDEELAYRLFCYCDWQHPDSALPEVVDDEE